MKKRVKSAATVLGIAGLLVPALVWGYAQFRAKLQPAHDADAINRFVKR